MSGILQRLKSALIPSRTAVRDPRPRPQYYDGSEKPDLVPPTRYAKGTRATPAPSPGASVF